MLSSELLIDAFDRVKETVHAAVADLTDDELAVRLDADANSIAWLVWHLTRVQDDHLAGVSDLDEVWTAAGWNDRFGLPFSDAAIGYGQGSDDVAKVRVPADLLLGYHDAVHAQTVAYLRDDLGARDDLAADLDEVVDERWDPPVTLAVRLVSVVNDTMQHAGQAAFIRGIVLRAR